jgi:hypothetical protein
MHSIWLAVLDVWYAATAPLPPDALEWERQIAYLSEQRSEDRLLAILRGELPH